LSLGACAVSRNHLGRKRYTLVAVFLVPYRSPFGLQSRLREPEV
jgi:hypothetical protein